MTTLVTFLTVVISTQIHPGGGRPRRLTRQTHPPPSGGGQMIMTERAWKVGRLEGWKVGRMEGWKVGRVEGWKVGRFDQRLTRQTHPPGGEGK